MTRCASCRRWLCPDCWQRKVSGEPWCEACIHHLFSEGGNVALAATFFLCAATAAWWGVRAQHSRNEDASQWWAVLLVVAAIVAIFSARRPPPAAAAEISERSTRDVAHPSIPRGAGHPYRAALRRASRRVALPLSGVKTAMVVLISMLVAALALPGLVNLPRLIEFELVLAGFWLLWGGVGSWLLYRGFRISNDHILARPRAATLAPPGSGERKLGDGCLSDMGCMLLDPWFLMLLALLLGGWLLVEFLLPPLFFLVYLVVRSGLAAIANDDHDCERHLGRSLAWGFAWSSVFVLPLAGLLFLFHELSG